MIAVVRSLIVAAAISHGVSSTSMLDVAQCESSLNPYAINGPNVGLYQLSKYGKLPAFEAWAVTQGLTPDWADPSQQANFTAEQFAAGEQWAWTCWRLVRS